MRFFVLIIQQLAKMHKIGLIILLSTIMAFSAPAISGNTTTTNYISVTELNEQAQSILQKIKEGGPFEYERDGIVFNNFEKQLPVQPRGYYREYTVPTPDVNNRGARRIVASNDDEYYYTEDHYRSFAQIHK